METLKSTESVTTTLQEITEKEVHGLCSLAESLWGVFLLKTKFRHLEPKIDQLTIDGCSITFLQKGIVSIPYLKIHYVGEESMLVIDSSDDALIGSIMFKDQEHKMLMRSAHPIMKSITGLFNNQSDVYISSARVLHHHLQQQFTDEATSITPLDLYRSLFTT